ncbi:MAG: hypothetical protein AAGA55_11665 [Planctomycetota bacterium]
MLGGCTSYTNVPSPENALYGQDPNARQASAATLAGLRWAVRKHPVSGPYLINLPFGTSTETAERIAAALPDGATIPDGTGMNLPTYHVPRVWIRLSDAKVDVVYPVDVAGEVPVNRGVTTWLHAGVRPWTVSRGQYWNPGTVDVPPTWVPVPQAQLDARDRAEREARRALRRGEGIDADASEPGSAPPESLPADQDSTPEPEPQSAADVQSEPADRTPPSADEPPASGSVWREVPVGAGG